MSLSAIQDILASFPGWATMELDHGDETSGQGNGQIRVKQLREPLWMLSAVSRQLTPNEIRYWKAKLDSLKNGKRLFYGYELTSYYPAAYPEGAWPTGVSFDGVSAQIYSLGSDGESLALELLPVGFVVTVGDMLSFSYGEGDPTPLALHRFVEGGTANGSGVTPELRVEPPIRTGAEAGATVSVKRPACHMMIAPNSVSTPRDVSGRGVISFSARQVIRG